MRNVGKQLRSRGAFLFASEFCFTNGKNFCLQRMIPKSGVRFSDKIMRQEREAERRQAHPSIVRATLADVTA